MAKKEKEERQMTKPLAVKMAYLQTAVSLPKLLNADATISLDKVKGLKSMEWVDSGLILVLENGRALIPAANVKGVALVD